MMKVSRLVGALATLALGVASAQGSAASFGSYNCESQAGLPAYQPLNVVLAEMNGDSLLDVVQGGGLGGDAIITFQAPGAIPPIVWTNLSIPLSSSGHSTCIAVGDLDGDGDNDVAELNRIAHNVGSWLNNGSGLFSACTESAVDPSGSWPIYSSYSPSFDLADLDHDGNLDLVAAVNKLLIAYGDGTGSFPTTATVSGSSDQQQLKLADLNLDGEYDVASLRSSDLEIRLGNGSAGFLSGTTYSYPPFNVIFGRNPVNPCIADVNMDGYPDVIAGDETVPSALLWTNNGSGGMGSPFSFDFTATLDVGTSPAVAELNQDGSPDLVVAGRTSNTNDSVVILVNDGTGTFGNSSVVNLTNSVNSPFGPSIFPLAALGDMNNDTENDLVVLAAGHGFYGIVPNIGWTLNTTTVPTPPAWTNMGYQHAGTYKPKLVGYGSLNAGMKFVFKLTQAPPSTPVAWFYSLSTGWTAPSPFKGGFLVPFDPGHGGFVNTLFSTNALGEVTVAVPALPAALPETLLQFWMPDSGASNGYSGSNGVKAN